MDTDNSFDSKFRGMIAEVVMSSITFFCMALEFFFPTKKEPKAISQQDIANIVFRERGKWHHGK